MQRLLQLMYCACVRDRVAACFITWIFELKHSHDLNLGLVCRYNILMIPFRLAFSETQVDRLCVRGPVGMRKTLFLPILPGFSHLHTDAIYSAQITNTSAQEGRG